LAPIDPNSSHAWGLSFSKAYLRHLFNINEILGLRVASTLNLSFYLDFMVTIREKIIDGNFDNWSKSLLRNMKNMKGM